MEAADSVLSGCDAGERAFSLGPPEIVKCIRAAHPVGREAGLDEIAAAIVFLLTDDASFITGAAIPVDCGNTAVISSH